MARTDASLLQRWSFYGSFLSTPQVHELCSGILLYNLNGSVAPHPTLEVSLQKSPVDNLDGMRPCSFAIPFIYQKDKTIKHDEGLRGAEGSIFDGGLQCPSGALHYRQFCCVC